MKLNKIVDRIQHEAQVLRGEETKDMTYASQNTFPDEVSALEAFQRSKDKLFNVTGWSSLSRFTANFTLHDQAGNPKPGAYPQIGDYIQVVLPGPMPENWVQVIHTITDDKRVEFTVQPSSGPREKKADEVEHFFNHKARSTFRVELDGLTITASEIGKNEEINNQQPQAGERALINTVIAEAGWLFYQEIQWKLLTDYLVHLQTT
jgi:hypothetical protein